MQAVKGNRQFNITEDEREEFVANGFDVYEGDKKVATGKAPVSKEAYDKLLKELEEERKKSGEREDVLAALKEYASLKGIDIGQASTVNGIMKKLKEGSQPPGGE